MNARSQNLCRTQSWGRSYACLQGTYILAGERSSNHLKKFKHFLFLWIQSEDTYEDKVKAQNNSLKHQENKWISYEFYKGHNPADQSYVYLPGKVCFFFFCFN